MKIAVICANGKEGKLIARKPSQEEQTLPLLSVARTSPQQKRSFRKTCLI